MTRSDRLKESQIRLLEINRVATDAAKLSFRTKIIDLQTDCIPTYTAVSYTWGKLAPTEVIYVDNEKVLIRQNLKQCLDTLVDIQKSCRAWDFIWADAICVDQENLHERNHQVRLMSQVYSKAEAVSVWLTNVPADRRGKLAASCGMRLARRLRYRRKSGAVEIVKAPYWSRAWVTQEFVLARDLDVYCLGGFASGDEIADMVEWVDSESAPINYSLHRNIKFGKASALRLIHTREAFHRDVSAMTGDRTFLFDLLHRHIEAQCEDARDKVFSILGFLEGDEKEYLDRLLPDYTLTLEEVMIVVITHAMAFGRWTRWDNFELLLEKLGLYSRDQLLRIVYCVGKLAPVYTLLKSTASKILQTLRNAQAMSYNQRVCPPPDVVNFLTWADHFIPVPRAIRSVTCGTLRSNSITGRHASV